jgi:hypothetical protein
MYLWQSKRAKHEAVEVQEKRFGYFPKRFRWRGKRYEVQGIERCWTIARRQPKLCFRVRCREGVFDLYQDLRLNAWQLVTLRA